MISCFIYFYLGLSGDENVFDIGDVVNIIPEIKREKLYNVKDLKQITASDPLFVIGPCGGPYPFIGVDSEASIIILILIEHLPIILRL